MEEHDAQKAKLEELEDTLEAKKEELRLKVGIRDGLCIIMDYHR